MQSQTLETEHEAQKTTTAPGSRNTSCSYEIMFSQINDTASRGKFKFVCLCGHKIFEHGPLEAVSLRGRRESLGNVCEISK
jgi:hypothetical protein